MLGVRPPPLAGRIFGRCNERPPARTNQRTPTSAGPGRPPVRGIRARPLVTFRPTPRQVASFRSCERALITGREGGCHAFARRGPRPDRLGPGGRPGLVGPGTSGPRGAPALRPPGRPSDYDRGRHETRG